MITRGFALRVPNSKNKAVLMYVQIYSDKNRSYLFARWDLSYPLMCLHEDSICDWLILCLLFLFCRRDFISKFHKEMVAQDGSR